jgi:hypothetical protein
MFLLRLFLITITLASSAAAATDSTGAPHKEVLRGYLIDMVCMKEEAGKSTDFAPNHSKKCLQMPACIHGGYGILLSSKEVFPFDDHGNELAKKLIASHRQEKGFVVKVTGVRQGSRFDVTRIE